MFKCNIGQIDNGFVVQHPAPASKIRGVEQQPQEPITHHCADVIELCEYLRSVIGE